MFQNIAFDTWQKSYRRRSLTQSVVPAVKRRGKGERKCSGRWRDPFFYLEEVLFWGKWWRWSEVVGRAKINWKRKEREKRRRRRIRKEEERGGPTAGEELIGGAERGRGGGGRGGGPECSFRGEPTQTRIRVVHRTPKKFQEIAL